MPADPTALNIQASSGSLKTLTISEELVCKGDTEIGGKVSITGTVAVEGEVSLSQGLDARGTRIANARLENTSIDGVVHGDVDFDGAVRFSGLNQKEVAAGALVLLGDDGEVRAATGLGLDEQEGVLVVERVSGHEVCANRLAGCLIKKDTCLYASPYRHTPARNTRTVHSDGDNHKYDPEQSIHEKHVLGLFSRSNI